jgi:hypothetical protein
VFDSRTRKLQVAKRACTKVQLWSHGNVRLTPGVKLHRAGVHKRPMDSLKVPTGKQRSRFSSRRIGMIQCESRAEEGVLHQGYSKHIETMSLSNTEVVDNLRQQLTVRKHNMFCEITPRYSSYQFNTHTGLH